MSLFFYSSSNQDYTHLFIPLTAQVISPERRKKLVTQHQRKKIPQLGAKFVFVFDCYDFIIDLNAADVVEMVWATNELHHTDHHIIPPKEIAKMKALKAAITRRQTATRKRKRAAGYVAEGGPEGDPPPPPPGGGEHVVAYACCSQVCNAVVGAIDEIMDMRGEMNDEEWEQYHPKIAENYRDELERKMQKHQNKGSALKFLD